MSAVSDAVRKVLDTSTATDPANIAVEVDALLSDEQRAEAWQSMLANYIRVSLASRRRVRPGDEDDRATPGGRSAVHARSSSAAGGHTSPRLAAAADWWRRALDGVYNVEGEWKRLADMSREDVLAVAAHRRREAAANAAVADRLERLAEAMKRARVRTVGKLAEEKARLAWGEAA